MENSENFISNGKYNYRYLRLEALVNAMIPRTPDLAQLYGTNMYYGALDFLTAEYLTMVLNYIKANILETMNWEERLSSSLIRFTMLGYYSEWFGYGTTRLNNPNQRILEFYPLSWEQVDYPGPAFSYISYEKEYNQINKEILNEF
ncbi:hypothetical protein [Anaerosacchariphilus polymeriproducens]|uniref:Uncharacterized protein n=1 Tax=Anaerosacchariphilus polymeriproducens TaxID=1812858 RepID=A0A371AQV7_9FIRM|nr:hypothetical protein [Anaerosacchariphilus polymeriproducens]RDU21956.1 hypothetical protein DWV06_15585 [Anaerosacchariphilus polymeriproducens]